MEIFAFVFLVLHIICGYIALTTGAVAMAGRKGGKIHRMAGRIFFYSMLGVTITSVVLSVVKGISFLLYVGIFVFSNTFFGWRAVRIRSGLPAPADWTVLLVTAVNGAFMILSMNVVLVVFGGISLLIVIRLLRHFISVARGKSSLARSWLSRHIGLMVGAYTGTFTAFLVVNVKSFGPAWLIWLLPAAVFMPLMQYWTWRYARPGNQRGMEEKR